MADTFNGFHRPIIGFGATYEQAARGEQTQQADSPTIFPEDEGLEVVYHFPPVQGIPSILGPR